MRKEAGWQWYHSICLALSCSRGNFQTNLCWPHPVTEQKVPLHLLIELTVHIIKSFCNIKAPWIRKQWAKINLHAVHLVEKLDHGRVGGHEDG
jgi:hypothetical protein